MKKEPKNSCFPAWAAPDERVTAAAIPYPGERAAHIVAMENVLLLLPCWGMAGDLSGDLIAACAARGRPPFVAILGDGAADGSEHLAQHCEKSARHNACVLGLPKDRLLFVGIRQGHLPRQEQSLFLPLKAAMAQLSWRHDCNAIAACAATVDSDALAAWQLARLLAEELDLALIGVLQRQDGEDVLF